LEERAGTAPSRRFHEVIYEALRHGIESGELEPGLVLGETEVGRLFGVSRTPATLALLQLQSDGLVRRFDGRGFLVGVTAELRPVRRPLRAAGIAPTADQSFDMTFRNQRDRIYPDVEKIVASVLAFGEFQVSENDLAGHFGSSRTIAREVLTQLARMGLVEQQRNGRWVTSSLDRRKIREHYELRMALEPVALKQAIPLLGETLVRRVDETIRKALADPDNLQSAQIVALESDLHVDIVLSCSNETMREALRRYQLPLLATHVAFENTRVPEHTRRVVEEHAAVIAAIVARDAEAAEMAMRAHLQTAMHTSEERLLKLDPSVLGPLPSYLKSAG